MAPLAIIGLKKALNAIAGDCVDERAILSATRTRRSDEFRGAWQPGATNVSWYSQGASNCAFSFAREMHERRAEADTVRTSCISSSPAIVFRIASNLCCPGESRRSAPPEARPVSICRTGRDRAPSAPSEADAGHRVLAADSRVGRIVTALEVGSHSVRHFRHDRRWPGGLKSGGIK